MKKILVIEDSNDINELLRKLLENNGLEVKSAFSGTEGLLYAKNESFQLILLDLMLPGMNGEDVLCKLSQMDKKPPVIIISAKTDIVNKVSLLESGADDYILKPFDMREVMARVNLQLNKASNNQKEDWGVEETICFKELKINNFSHTITINEKELKLTRQEYNILYLLYSNPTKVFTKQELFHGAWDDYYEGEDKTINVHISNIRNKIKQYTDESYIETVWGIGFRAAR